MKTYTSLSYLDSLGGPGGVKSNFNVNLLPKNMPPYYLKCFKDRAKLFIIKLVQISSTIIQTGTNNKYLPVKLNTNFIYYLQKNQIYTVQNLVRNSGK